MMFDWTGSPAVPHYAPTALGIVWTGGQGGVVPPPVGVLSTYIPTWRPRRR